MQDASLWLGELGLTEQHMRQGLASYDPEAHRALAFRHGGYDPAMACHAFGGYALWYLGYPDQALAHHRQAVAHARELAHQPTLVFALSHAALLHQFRGEPDLAASARRRRSRSRTSRGSHSGGPRDGFARLGPDAPPIARGRYRADPRGPA
jgi:hypothetical protein